jgi:hypothetical protein
MKVLLALLFALAAAPASAQSREVINFPPGADASRDGFFAAIVTTEDLERFGAAWVAGNPQSALTRIATRGRELKILILFSGCRAGNDGKCNLSGRFTIVPPGGAQPGTIDVNDLSRERAGGGVLLAAGPTLTIDPPDPMGEWSIQADITDNVRGTTVTVRTPIIVDTPPTGSAS